jgi:hypothetical protein
MSNAPYPPGQPQPQQPPPGYPPQGYAPPPPPGYPPAGQPLNYQQPQFGGGGPPPGQYAPCPRCRCPYARPVKFTWWGGALGPRMLSHVKCANCGNPYNGKKGVDNTTGIVIYTVVCAVIGLAIGVMLIMSKVF